MKVSEEKEGTYLELELEEGMFEIPTEIISSQKLGMPRIVEAPYDDPQGNPITFDLDYLGSSRGDSPVPGPLECLRPGHNRVCVWR